jgi:hypothetical protein
MNTRRKGFTLIGALIVIVVLGPLLLVAVKRTIESHTRFCIANAFDKIDEIGLEEARKLNGKDYIGIEISSIGLENLSTEKQSALTTAVERGWIYEDEIETRQREYIEKRKSELKVDIEKLEKMRESLDVNEPNQPETLIK